MIFSSLIIFTHNVLTLHEFFEPCWIIANVCLISETITFRCSRLICESIATSVRCVQLIVSTISWRDMRVVTLSDLASRAWPWMLPRPRGYPSRLHETLTLNSLYLDLSTAFTATSRRKVDRISIYGRRNGVRSDFNYDATPYRMRSLLCGIEITCFRIDLGMREDVGQFRKESNCAVSTKRSFTNSVLFFKRTIHGLIFECNRW